MGAYNMSLIKCPECQKDISDSAKICPNCGYSLKSKYIKSIKTNKKILLLPVITIVVLAFCIVIKNLTFDYSFKKYGKIGEYSKEVEEAHKNRNSREESSSISIYDDSKDEIVYREGNIAFLGKKGVILIHTDKKYIIKQIDFVYSPIDNSHKWDFTEGKVYDDLFSDTKNYYDSVLKRYSSKLGNDYSYLNYDLISEGVYWEKDDKNIELMLCDYFRKFGIYEKPQVKISVCKR